jgi:hypothetical protein
MEGKRKIMAILTILLLMTMPIGVVQASKTIEKKTENKSIPIEIITLDSDKIQKKQTIHITEEELEEFENTVSILIDKIQSANSWQGIRNIINNFLKGNKFGIFTILKALLSKIIAFRTYVISSGHSYKFNPIKKGSLKIRKRLSLWHYSSGKMIKDRTIILKPLALKFKILKGSQFGIMTRFTGAHIYVARRFPQKSYTFFMGLARHASGIQIPNGN